MRFGARSKNRTSETCLMSNEAEQTAQRLAKLKEIVDLGGPALSLRLRPHRHHLGPSSRPTAGRTVSVLRGRAARGARGRTAARDSAASARVTFLRHLPTAGRAFRRTSVRNAMPARDYQIAKAARFRRLPSVVEGAALPHEDETNADDLGVGRGAARQVRAADAGRKVARPHRRRRRGGYRQRLSRF